MAGRFEIYQDRAGSYRERLHDQDGRVVAVGGAYASEWEARLNCRAIREAADGARIVAIENGEEVPL